MPSLNNIEFRSNGESPEPSAPPQSTPSHETLILAVVIPVSLVVILVTAFCVFRYKAKKQYGPTLGQERALYPIKGASRRRFLHILGLGKRSDDSEMYPRLGRKLNGYSSSSNGSWASRGRSGSGGRSSDWNREAGLRKPQNIYVRTERSTGNPNGISPSPNESGNPWDPRGLPTYEVRITAGNGPE